MPYSVTMVRAMSVARWRSFWAPVEISWNTSSSAIVPPSRTATLSSSSVRDPLTNPAAAAVEGDTSGVHGLTGIMPEPVLFTRAIDPNGSMRTRLGCHAFEASTKSHEVCFFYVFTIICFAKLF